MKSKKILRKIDKYRNKFILIDFVTLEDSYYCRVWDVRGPDGHTKNTDNYKTAKAAFLAAFIVSFKMIKERH